MVIVAAGLSPAWQQILTFDSLRPNEVNRAQEAYWCASGKVLNVGIALAHLQAEAITIAPLGGPPRDDIVQEFNSFGAQAQWIEVAGATRVCTTIIEKATGGTTELVTSAASLSVDELARFESVCSAAMERAEVVVLSGSLPAGTPADIYRRLLQRTNARAILDIRGKELDEALVWRPFMVKPNREELGQTVGRNLATDTELLSAMRELNRRGAQWVVVTQGKHDVWASCDNEMYRLRPPVVESINPIGCGDCLAAAIAWQLAQGQSVPESLRIGIAAAALNATTLLPSRLDAENVLALAESVTIERA